MLFALEMVWMVSKWSRDAGGADGADNVSGRCWDVDVVMLGMVFWSSLCVTSVSCCGCWGKRLSTVNENGSTVRSACNSCNFVTETTLHARSFAVK